MHACLKHLPPCTTTAWRNIARCETHFRNQPRTCSRCLRGKHNAERTTQTRRSEGKWATIILPVRCVSHSSHGVLLNDVSRHQAAHRLATQIFSLNMLLVKETRLYLREYCSVNSSSNSLWKEFSNASVVRPFPRHDRKQSRRTLENP